MGSKIIVQISDSKTKVEVEYYENFDLDNVITPVNVDRLEQLLKQTNYGPGGWLQTWFQYWISRKDKGQYDST